MQIRLSLLAGLALTVLAACDEPGDGFVFRDTTGDNVELANAAAAAATPPGSLPIGGSATYTGVMAASVAGDYSGSLYADLSMTLDFTSGDVSGQVTQVDLIDDFGGTVQNIDGTLIITGTNNNGIIGAAAGGVLTGGVNDPLTGLAAADFVLLGTVRTDVTAADTVYGTVTGDVTGDFNLDLSDGEFAGTTP